MSVIKIVVEKLDDGYILTERGNRITSIYQFNTFFIFGESKQIENTRVKTDVIIADMLF